MVRTAWPWKSALAYEMESNKQVLQAPTLLLAALSKEHNNMSEQMQPNMSLQKG